MINFIWIVLITIVGTVIGSAVLVIALYLLWDGLVKFILKRKVPKNKETMLDGGKDDKKNEKEVKLTDGEYREFERLREAAIRERTTEAGINSERFYSNEPRDVKLDAIAGEVVKSDKPTDRKW